MHKLSSFREIQAIGSAIHRDRSHLETHEKGICEFVHPRHTHDQFISLFIAEKLTLYYEYGLAQARASLKSGDLDATIEACEYSLLKWWPREERAFDLLKEALNLTNRTVDDHIANVVFGNSKLLGNSSRFLWKACFFRGRVELWVDRALVTLFWALVAIMIVSMLAETDGPFAAYNQIVMMLFLTGAGALAASGILKILLQRLPDPSLLRFYWYFNLDWIDGRYHWDSHNWPESFRPTY